MIAKEIRPETLALRRIFLIQLGLVIVATALIIAGAAIENAKGAEHGVGFFWFAFIGGCLGSSISTLRRSRANKAALREIGKSWTALLLPHLYGGLMAGLAYILFLSGILSGTGKSGLLTSNLFPDFTLADSTARPSMTTYLALRPASIADAGRLLVWCFLAGYSERFITGILDQLDSKGSAAKTDDATGAGSSSHQRSATATFTSSATELNELELKPSPADATPSRAGKF